MVSPCVLMVCHALSVYVHDRMALQLMFNSRTKPKRNVVWTQHILTPPPRQSVYLPTYPDTRAALFLDHPQQKVSYQNNAMIL